MDQEDVQLMVANREKALFPADPRDWHGMDGEWMWVEEIKDNIYRVLNIPLYAYGVSMNDLVTLRRENGKLSFEGIERQGGNHTYRVLLRSGYYAQDFNKRWQELADLGCDYESSKNPEDVFGINVPSKSDVNQVYVVLERVQNEGVWYFDEGNFEGSSS